MKLKCILPYFLSFMIVLCALAIMYAGYLSFIHYQVPMRVNYSHPVSVATEESDRAKLIDKPVVRVGEPFFTYRDYCIIANVKVLRNERWLISTDGKNRDVALPLLPTRVVRGKGKCDARTFLNQLPDGVSPGEYYFHVIWFYTVSTNPIATMEWSWPDIKIVVEEAKNNLAGPRGATGKIGPKGEKGEQGGFSLFGKR